MIKHRLLALTLPVAIGLAAAGTLASPSMSPAYGASQPQQITVNGHCTGRSQSVLQANREDTGKLSVDFSVDMIVHRAGVAWNVRVADNGTVVWRGTRRTLADGSFDTNLLFAPRRGANVITAMATNPATGETCRASGTL
jgi:hypothetical protein